MNIQNLNFTTFWFSRIICRQFYQNNICRYSCRRVDFLSRTLISTVPFRSRSWRNWFFECCRHTRSDSNVLVLHCITKCSCKFCIYVFCSYILWAYIGTAYIYFELNSVPISYVRTRYTFPRMKLGFNLYCCRGLVRFVNTYSWFTLSVFQHLTCNTKNMYNA